MGVSLSVQVEVEVEVFGYWLKVVGTTVLRAGDEKVEDDKVLTSVTVALTASLLKFD